MAYQKLALAEGTPSIVAKLIRGGVEPFLQDVHCALRLPLRRPNLPAGLNFIIAHALLGVVAGASSAFYRRHQFDGEAFKGLLVEFYPWDLEPHDAEDPASKSAILWDTFRNPFAHSVGLAYEKKGGQREFKPRGYNVKVGRGNASLKEREIVAMERSATRPNFHRSTLVVTPEKRVLWVEPFYWGIRMMLLRLTRDAALMAEVEVSVREGLAKHGGVVRI
jgi:hypothetical protein